MEDVFQIILGQEGEKIQKKRWNSESPWMASTGSGSKKWACNRRKGTYPKIFAHEAIDNRIEETVGLFRNGRERETNPVYE